LAQSKPAVAVREEQLTIATVDRLLDTAAGMFWTKSYAATTTREIASALQIQQASLYYHIASKEDLLYQLCLASVRQFLSDTPAAMNGSADPRERVRVLIHRHVHTLLKHQKRNATMLTELRSLSSRHRAEVVELRERYAHLVRSELESAQRAGVLRCDVSAKYLCLALLNMLNWSALWFREDQALSVDALADLFTGIFLRGVTAPAERRHLPPAPDLANMPKTSQRRPRKPLNTAENATVERLLDAAAALFSSKGYAATSTREVAALTGMRKASLYYHIEGKEDLLYDICKASLERIRSDVETAVQGVRDPLERTRAMICTHVESMLRDQNEHAATLAEMHALSQERLAQVVALRDAHENLIRSVLEDAQKAGVLRMDVDVKYLCLSVLGLTNRVLVWYRRRGPLTPGQIGEVLASVFLGGAESGGLEAT
jgi:AcrR family transcriptional regulator